jgi:hypothetical protein
MAAAHARQKEQVIIVLEIRPERLAYFRERARSMNTSDTQADELINMLSRIFLTVIDIARGTDAVQLAREQRLSQSFEKAARHAINEASENARLVDLGEEGVITSNPKPEGTHDPENGYQKSSHILPRL